MPDANTADNTRLVLWELWRRSFAELGLVAPAAEFEALLAAWSGPGRHYHGLKHLLAGVRHLQSLFTGQPWPSALALAWFFHDAVYDPMRHDNEAVSAAWARRTLLAAGGQPPLVDSVERLIMVTLHTQAPAADDERLFVDIDLAVLGAPRDVYDDYARAVRREYECVPEAAFNAGRLKVMRGFLGPDGKKPIFHTAWGIAAFDEQARANISSEIALLEILVA